MFSFQIREVSWEAQGQLDRLNASTCNEATKNSMSDYWSGDALYFTTEFADIQSRLNAETFLCGGKATER